MVLQITFNRRKAEEIGDPDTKQNGGRFRPGLVDTYRAQVTEDTDVTLLHASCGCLRRGYFFNCHLAITQTFSRWSFEKKKKLPKNTDTGAACKTNPQKVC